VDLALPPSRYLLGEARQDRELVALAYEALSETFLRYFRKWGYKHLADDAVAEVFAIFLCSKKVSTLDHAKATLWRIAKFARVRHARAWALSDQEAPRCSCGCGSRVGPDPDQYGSWRRFIHDHHQGPPALDYAATLTEAEARGKLRLRFGTNEEASRVAKRLPSSSAARRLRRRGLKLSCRLCSPLEVEIKVFHCG